MKYELYMLWRVCQRIEHKGPIKEKGDMQFGAVSYRVIVDLEN